MRSRRAPGSCANRRLETGGVPCGAKLLLSLETSMGSKVRDFFLLNHFMGLSFASLAVLLFFLEGEGWRVGAWPSIDGLGGFPLKRS